MIFPRFATGLKHASLLFAVASAIGTVMLLPISSTANAQNPDNLVWLEGESATTIPEPGSAGGYVSPELLSGGKVLQVIIPAKEVEAKVPESGLVVEYQFEAPEGGEYQAWNRVGFSGIRAPFEWRVNDGDWHENNQEDAPITNVQELGFWNPIGWTKMGWAQLKQGQNTLEIRLTRRMTGEGEKQKLDNLRYVSDVLVFAQGEFQPNFSRKPGDAGDNELAGQAASQTFALPADKAGEPRVQTTLDGAWQIAPWDEIGEISEEDRVSGPDALPNLDNLTWYGMQIPGNRNTALPEFKYSHRNIFRTQLEVPADYQGHSFFFDFRELNLMATLFINGERVGFQDIVVGRWFIDVSDFLEPGKTNEIAVVIKDNFYAMRGKDGETVRQSQYYPDELFGRNQGVTMRFDYPVKGVNRVGITDSVRVIATSGPVAATDVFVKPFPVTKKTMEIDITLTNTGQTEQQVTVQPSIAPAEEGAETALTLPPQKVTAQAGGEIVVSFTAPTQDLELWWPEDPQLYKLSTVVVADGETIDRSTTRFGVREWELRGNRFFLNDRKMHLRTDLTYYGAEPDELDEVLAEWDRIGINNFRLRFQWPWAGMTNDEFLTWADENGVNVRKNAGTFDGQHASYDLKENPVLFENWRRQILNRATAHRNHPSVFIWELDNELIYINARNLGGLDFAEPEFTKTSNELMAMDPTRATVIGGGAALRDESLPTYGIHYFEVDDRHYPDEAYTAEKSLAREGSMEDGRVWPVEFEKKPIFFSETAFLPGRSPDAFAAVGGERTFLGKSESKHATGMIAHWLSAGYRWKGFGAVHFWFNHDFTDGSYIEAWQDIAALPRQWDWVFGSGEKIDRLYRLFNDTAETGPLTMTWKLALEGKDPVSGQVEKTVQPGEFADIPFAFAVPKVDNLVTGQFLVTVTDQEGEEVFASTRDVRVHPKSQIELAGQPRIVLWSKDPKVAQRLQANGLTGQSINSLDEVPEDFDLLIVGPDTVSKEEATDPAWIRLAAGGKKILVLEQEHPLHYQAVATNSDITDYVGRMSFSQNRDHPIFDGLAQEDLRFWGDDHTVYKNVYTKPTRGGQSLVHCDEKLGYSALIESPVDEGLMILVQMKIGEKLNQDIVAQRLFDNLVEYVATYQRVERPTALAAPADSPLAKVVSEMGVEFQQVEDPVAAIENPDLGVLIIPGDPETLSTLVDNLEKVTTFQENGGWILISEVTPESLDSFNKIAGVDHLIRPFRMEKTQFPATRDPLTAGLSLRDVVMSSGERIQVFNRDEWPSKDAFKYVVDLYDIAPFAEFPPPGYWNDPETTGSGTDSWPLNMVNGYFADAHWRLIFSIHLHMGDPTHWTMTFPREEEVVGFTVKPNDIYHEIETIEVSFDEDPATARDLTLDGAGGPQDFTFDDAPKARSMSINIKDWKETGRQDVIGIDNLSIRVKRSEDFNNRVRPMLNIGGLVRYNRGEGGVILSQYQLGIAESNPVNAAKKKTVLATILRNLGAPFSGGGLVVAGLNLAYKPVSLEDHANLYLRSEQGWPHNKADLGAFPVGEMTFGDVNFDVRDFKTSPLESAVTLKHNRLKSNAEGDAVKGIAISDKADALFFLHTFMQDREWKASRRDNDPPALWQYHVHYDDGSQEIIDVTLNRHVDPWLQPEPDALPEAGIAWIGSAGDEVEERATVYQMQWNNPHPDKPIKSIDLTYGPDGGKWGIPVLLGITLAEQQE